MKTLKRIAAALALSAAALVSTGSAEAGDHCFAPSYGYAPAACSPHACAPVVAPPVCRTYTIYYRDCAHSAWTAYGRYHRVHDAVHTAEHIEALGYETFIR